MKIHAVIFTNDNKAMCGEYLHEFERENGLLPIVIPAYSFKIKYKPETHCKKCFVKIRKYGTGEPIKKPTEQQAVKQSGKY